MTEQSSLEAFPHERLVQTYEYILMSLFVWSVTLM